MSRRAVIAVVAFLCWSLAGSQALAQSRYPVERNHSPITRQVGDRLRAIVAAGSSQGRHEDRFIKVGDSITVSPDYFMGQFVHPDYDPAIHSTSDLTRDLDRSEYLRPGLEHFLAGDLGGGVTSFDRQSLAAQVGQTASWAVSGEPSPLTQELAAVSPAFAVIMFGTNDIGWWPDQLYTMSWILQHLGEIVDQCVAEGTVPILKAPPPRLGYELQMLTLSHLIRALAQGRQVPFIDYHRAMMPLPGYGLGGDGVHPNVYQWNWTCHLTPAGLQYGTTMHNLVAMQAFDRARRATLAGAPALDFEPPALAGDGSVSTPFDIDGLPFIDARATTAGELDVTYSMVLTESRQLRLMVVDPDGTDVDITLLDGSLTFLDSDDGLLDLSLGPGQYHVVIETRDGSPGNVGDYQLVVMDRASTGLPGGSGIFLDGATASPAEVGPGEPVSVTFTATALDDGAITGVVLDLSELGGGASVAMSPLGDGSYSHTAALPAQSLGEKLVTVTAEDDEGHQESVPVFVLVGTTLTVTNLGLVGGSGTVTSDPPGISCGLDCREELPTGAAVTLTATPDGGSVFAGWGGDCAGTDSRCTLVMTGSRSVTAAFEPEGLTYALTVARDGTGEGSVISDPAGEDCGLDCAEDYPSGAAVTLTAAAGADSVFTGWGGDCTGTGACVLVMSGNRAVTAAFASTNVPPVSIYEDALAAGWANWSWSATIDLAGTSPVHAGSHAVNATLGAWGAFSPATQTAVIDTAGYRDLRFWVHGGSGGDKVLTVSTQAVADDSGTESPSVEVTAAAGAWREVTIPLTELGDPVAVARVNVMNFSASALGTVTFDDIGLVPFPAGGVFADGFESGDLGQWSSSSGR